MEQGQRRIGAKVDGVAPIVNCALTIPRRQGATCELCRESLNWGLPRPLTIKGNLDRGPLTTPKSLPACCMPPPRFRNGRPLRNQRASIVSAVHRGSPEPPHTKHRWVGDHYHPEGAASCPPIVPLPPLRNSNPLRNEGASHSERGSLTTTSSWRSCLVLPHFYPIFTPLRFIVLPWFYLFLTLFLPHSAPSFLPPFYPVFTPLVKGKMPNLPRFYPIFTPPPIFTLSTVLPRFSPGFTPFLVLRACQFSCFYPRHKTAHFLLVVPGAAPPVHHHLRWPLPSLLIY